MGLAGTVSSPWLGASSYESTRLVIGQFGWHYRWVAICVSPRILTVCLHLCSCFRPIFRKICRTIGAIVAAVITGVFAIIATYIRPRRKSPADNEAGSNADGAAVDGAAP